MSQITSSRRQLDRLDAPAAFGATTFGNLRPYVPQNAPHPFAPAPVRDENRAAVIRSARRARSLNQCTSCAYVLLPNGKCGNC